ncbi:oxidoreductase [Comamonas serinivorans]|uniref:Oxidoreductase n=1 Tax=Comamonas serinivorans TaxID=1082851 RepID=A0A1Y0EMX8_9BURK|nr:oxidoreductase [Comamonas serinivorans]
MTAEPTFTVRVAGRRPLADDTVALELRALDGAPLPRFEAGAHIDVHAGPGLVRQYSLCNPPSESDRYVIGVLRDPASRGGSAALHDGCPVGAQLTISAPRNHFPLQVQRRSVLLAGGIGVTPLLCMAHALQAAGTPFELHHCARSPAKAAFADELAAFGAQAHRHLHEDIAQQQAVLTPILQRQAVGDDEVYVCGPTAFIDWVCAQAEALGIAPARVHVEYFKPLAVDTTGDGAFEVKLASSGQVLHIPADRSVADVLVEAGVDLYTSCSEGTCGTCVTRVLAGTPLHRDVFLTDAEHDSGELFTPCCSRACSPLLVLDL